MQYRKKPVIVEATRWWWKGDHPKVIYPIPNTSRKADIRCEYCTKAMGKHGWIETLQGGHMVCPGDWIITDVRVKDKKAHGHFYPCKPDIFEKTYEPV